MRSGVRKVIGTAVLALLAGGTLLATSASAVEPGEGAPPDPGCTFVISGLGDGFTAPAGGTAVTVTGTVGPPVAGVLVELLVNGERPAPEEVAPNPLEPAAGTGSFSFGPFTAFPGDDISVSYTYGNQNAYSNFCVGPGGQSVIRVQPASVAVERPPARALALTGSSGTTSNVLIALAAIALGTVLVVATRRRSRVKA